jgi:hypothetical protein
VVLFRFAAVTFSRMDPEGKLIMGFRKASSSVAIQVTNHSHFPDSNLNHINIDTKITK